ncbi:MAG: hypothetical protein QOF33_1913 [Thermomicrobiales bacterium]|jgi:hypothetical protein|nr:hypothetical protein [Thermomicrobiales bacterium]
MDTLNGVEQLTDEQLLETFGTSEAPEDRGFDEATEARVIAHELVRARGRLAFYRALYSSFIDVGKPIVIENLNDQDADDHVPAKLVFADDLSEIEQVGETDGIAVWTEPDLLIALSHERAIVDYFTELLDELAPAVQRP